jgi:hypothetical protein
VANKSLMCVAAIMAAVGLAASAKGDVVTLTFEGIANMSAVGNYYNGGGGGNLGVVFSPNAIAGIDIAAGGGANAGNDPSGVTTMAFLTGSASTLNYAAGFDTGFSFYYAAGQSGFIKVYDDVNATGNVLANLALPTTPNPYYDWIPIGVSFAGTAKSIDFAGTANYIAFDNITFGSVTPTDTSVPLPEGAWMGMAGLGCAAFFVRRRKVA